MRFGSDISEPLLFVHPHHGYTWHFLCLILGAYQHKCCCACTCLMQEEVRNIQEVNLVAKVPHVYKRQQEITGIILTSFCYYYLCKITGKISLFVLFRKSGLCTLHFYSMSELAVVTKGHFPFQLHVAYSLIFSLGRFPLAFG